MKEEKKTWQALANALPDVPPLYPDEDPTKAPLPDESLLDPEEVKMLSALKDPPFSTMRKDIQSRVQTIRSELEFKVDHLATNVHILNQGVLTAGREADRVLGLSSDRLKERQEREKIATGTKDLPTMEVLRSLGRILPEDSA